MKLVISTQKAPAAVGPYSQAIVAGGLVFCSGQIALDPETGELAGDTASRQLEQCLKNLGAVLKAAGVTFEHVVKTTVFLTDMADFAAVNLVYERSFTGPTPPARACVQVSALPKAALVEIEAIALAPTGAK